MTGDTPSPATAPLAAARFAGTWIAVVGDGSAARRVDRLPLLEPAANPTDGCDLSVHAAGPADLPQVARRGRIAVVFEGRLDDRDELRGRLGIEPGRAASDGELALAAYDRWGDELPERLHGSYAVVLWDGDERRLLAVRDRMGHRPLFWSRFGSGIVLATSPAIVMLHPGVSRELHRASMAEILCFRFLDPFETCHAHVVRLPPGHRLDWRPGSEARARRYWIARFTEDLPSDEVAERFAEVFDRAVARCLESGSPGIFLSGGLDSANVALSATDQRRAVAAEAPLALSLAFPDEVDEVAVQTGVANQLGLEQVLMPFWEAAGHERTLLRAAELSAELPAPLINLWHPAYESLGREAVRRGRRAILTGHGGDEWADAGIGYAAYLIRRGDLPGLYRLWRVALRSYPVPVPILARNLLWRYGARPVLVEAAKTLLGPFASRVQRARQRRFIDVTTPDFLAPDPELRRTMDERATAMLPLQRFSSPYGHKTPRYFASKLVILNHESNFESGRRLGVPILSPFLDPDLVELVCRMRAEDFYSGGRNKAMLRQRATPRLPELGFDRQKKLPATSFMRRLVQRQTDSTWEALGGVQRLADLGIADAAKLRETLHLVVSGRDLRASNLSVFTFALESWARVH